MENLKVGELLKCVKPHPNSSRFTKGKVYPVYKIYYYYSPTSGDRPREFGVRDDNGKIKRYKIRSKHQFERASGEDLYNEAQAYVMLTFVREIEHRVGIWFQLNGAKNKKVEEQYISERDDLVHEYLVKIIKAGYGQVEPH